MARVSKYLAQLQASMEAVVSLVDRDCLRAELAAALARQGQEEVAEKLLLELRERYLSQPSNPVLPWINYAESKVCEAKGDGRACIDKMQRAYILSGIFALVRLRALSAAVMAQLLWNDERLPEAVPYIRESFKIAALDDHFSRCRASLLMGDILITSRRIDLAQPWLVRGRTQAQASGDDVAMSNHTFNISVARHMTLRQAILSRSSDSTDELRVKTFWEASNNFDRAIGILRAQGRQSTGAALLSLRGQAEQSLRLYQEILTGPKIVSSGRKKAQWLADVAWCYARVGQADKSLSAIGESLNCDVPTNQVDDRAATHSYLSLAYRDLGNPLKFEEHDARAQLLWAEYRDYQDRCVALCESITENG